MKTYRHLIQGGTFDHFHAGHELFLKSALHATGHRLTIGVATDPLYRSKRLAGTIESYTEREKNVKNFVAKINQKNIITDIIPISTVYGSSLTDVTIDGIVVTPETEPGALAINEKRKEIGMKPLNVINVPLVMADDGAPISSFRIRYGDIDRKGMSYYKFLVSNGELIMPEALRTELGRPIGDLFPGSLTDSLPVVNAILSTIREFTPPMVFTIGDIIYQKLSEAGYRQLVAVIDYKSRRKALNEENFSGEPRPAIPKYRNRPGTIQAEAVIPLAQARDRYMNERNPQIIVIEGEEDLLALPAVLLAPLGSFVMYGQHGEGAVVIRVTEERKKFVLERLRRFGRS